jgi:hypothetical protein
VSFEDELASLRAELARERARADSLQEIVHALAARPTVQPALERRVRADARALVWARARLGVPLPPPMVEAYDPPDFNLRLRTLEEQAAWQDEEDKRMAPIRAARAEQLRLRSRRFVYFMQERANASAPIKIGISRDVERRRGELQRAERVILSVLASIEGTMRDEQTLHERFAAHRLHGEWFTPALEILAHIAALNGVKE